MVSTRKTRQRANHKPQENVRRLTCGSVMMKPHYVYDDASVFDVLEKITRHNWDHIFILNDEGVPMGRIHAVDVLKIIAKKTVNRSVAWMYAIPAIQLVNLPPLCVKMSTPLLKAGALMLTHDLNQIGILDAEGALVGVVGFKTMAKHLPRYIL